MISRTDTIKLLQERSTLPPVMKALAVATLYKTTDSNFAEKFPLAMRALRMLVNKDFTSAEKLLVENGIAPSVVTVIAPLVSALGEDERKKAIALIDELENGNSNKVE